MMAARDRPVNRISYPSRTEDSSLIFRSFSRVGDFGQKRRHQAFPHRLPAG